MKAFSVDTQNEVRLGKTEYRLLFFNLKHSHIPLMPYSKDSITQFHIQLQLDGSSFKYANSDWCQIKSGRSVKKT